MKLSKTDDADSESSVNGKERNIIGAGYASRRFAYTPSPVKKKGLTAEQLERKREAKETRNMSQAERDSMIIERHLHRKWEREQATALALEEANKAYFKMVVGLVSHVVVHGSVSAGLGNALLVIESKNEKERVRVRMEEEQARNEEMLKEQEEASVELLKEKQQKLAKKSGLLSQ